MVRPKRIIFKKYSKIGIFYGLVILFLVAGLFTYVLILGPIQQCASVEFCGPAEPFEFNFSWTRTIITLLIISLSALILFKTPYLGGLNDNERIILKEIYSNNEKMITYKLIKLLRNKDDQFKKMDNKQIYRIIDKLRKWHLIELDSEKKISLTDFGLSYNNFNN